MATKKKNGSIEEVYQLPSLGKLYGDDYPSEVSIRSMTTFEEKVRLGNQGFYQTMCKLLNTVVTSPENFKAEDLIMADFSFLIYKMRVVSYGKNYKVQVTCPHCNKSSTININLDDLEVNYIRDGHKEPFEVGPLPRSGDIIQCKYLRIRDILANEQRVREIERLHPDYEGDPNYILELASKISSVNGESKIFPELQMYVEGLQAIDSSYLRQAYEHFADNDLGMNNICLATCSHCGEEFNFSLPFTSEFFRPTFDF